MTVRRVASLVLVALIAGAIAAHADSGSAPRPVRTPARVVAAPAPSRPYAGTTPFASACAAPVTSTVRAAAGSAPKAHVRPETGSK